MKKYSPNYGFTLIELSIVLVIIGLIVGGVLVGQSLIRTSELRSIITDEQKYVTAVNTFRTKYNELPGDMTDATYYWGTDPDGCPNSTPYTNAQITTCNGNGNGFIENEGTGATGGANMFENFRAWQQLANAHLIQGAYTGTPGPNGWTDNEPGLNVPATRMGNGGFEWVVFGSSSAVWGYFPTASVSAQYLLLGSTSAIYGYSLQGPLFIPADAQAIDSKIDDGLPITGNVLASGTFDGGCLTSNNYTMTTKTPYCSLLIQVKSW